MTGMPKISMMDLLPMVATVAMAMGGMVTYLNMNFATAADMQQVEEQLGELNALALGNQIRAMMYEMCKDPDNEVLAAMIEEQRHKYHVRTESVFPWICTP